MRQLSAFAAQRARPGPVDLVADVREELASMHAAIA